MSEPEPPIPQDPQFATTHWGSSFALPVRIRPKRWRR